MTLQKARSKARKLLRNRNRCELADYCPCLYIVWSNEEWDNSGDHFHVATEFDLDTYYSGCHVEECIENTGHGIKTWNGHSSILQGD